jgi:hypothetical protein
MAVADSASTAVRPDRDALRDHLVAARIAGDVQTSRQNNLANIGRLLDRHVDHTFGLELDRTWTFDEVVALLAERVGISADAAHRFGSDTIDPERTLEALDAMAERLRLAAERAERVLVASGHPSGVYAVHLEVAAALARTGCRLVTVGEGLAVPELDGSYREVRYLGGVALVSDRGALGHTHSPAPMAGILAELAAAGEPPPDLVVADHGWCGAAGEAGIDTVGFADSNDPALFVGAAEGKVAVAVPLDDNVLPLLYRPVAARLVAALA